jgi:hypothetical protein
VKANKKRGLAARAERVEITKAIETGTAPKLPDAPTQSLRSERDVLNLLRASLTNEALLNLFAAIVHNATQGDSASLNFLSKHIAGNGKISLSDLMNPPTIEKS